MSYIPLPTTPAEPVFLVDPETGLPIPSPFPVVVTGVVTTTTPVPIGWMTVSETGAIQVGTSSTQLLASNGARKFFYLANNSQNQVYVQFGNPAIFGRGLRLNPGGVFSMGGDELFLGTINAVGITLTEIDILEGE